VFILGEVSTNVRDHPVFHVIQD